MLPYPSRSYPSITQRKRTQDVLASFLLAFHSFFRGRRTLATVLFVLLCHLPRTRLTGVNVPFLLSPIRRKKLNVAATRVNFTRKALNVINLALKNVLKNVTMTHRKLHH